MLGKPNKTQDWKMNGTDKPEQTAVNDSGTLVGSDTPLTQEGSQDVPDDLPSMRRLLTETRIAHGADSPVGHRCSNLLAQISNYRTAEGEQRANLSKLISRQMAELTLLMATR